MTAIYVNTFYGENPKLDPRLLPNNWAQSAIGCQFYSGNLSALKQALDAGLTVLSNAKTIFQYQNEHWFSWPVEVDAVSSPVINDPWERVYYTGDGYPKVTNNTIFNGENMPAAAYRLGVQAPEQIITGAVTEGADSSTFDVNDLEERYYTHTFVTEQGEEGPPGEASEKILINSPFDPDTSVSLSLSPPNTNESNITHRRIYRSVTGGGISDYLLVAEIPIAITLFIDRLQSEELGLSLDTYDYEMPPEELQGLTTMANGILVGFFGNTLCFSEAYLPYAWPKKYQSTTEHNIVALVAMGNSIAVLTEGNPYIYSGVTPDTINGRKLESKQACVSKRSATIVNGMLIYASPDGLVTLSDSRVKPLTAGIFTREQWQQYSPETLEAYSQEGRYLAFYGIGLDKAFIFDPDKKDIRHFNDTAYCGFNSLINDALYISEGGNLSIWEAGQDNMSFTWRSKRYETSNVYFNCGLVKCRDVSLVGLKIFADEVEILHFEPGELPLNAFRLPSVRADNWEFELYGTGEVYSIVLASSMVEIKGVING